MNKQDKVKTYTMSCLLFSPSLQYLITAELDCQWFLKAFVEQTSHSEKSFTTLANTDSLQII